MKKIAIIVVLSGMFFSLIVIIFTAIAVFIIQTRKSNDSDDLEVFGTTPFSFHSSDTKSYRTHKKLDSEKVTVLFTRNGK